MNRLKVAALAGLMTVGAAAPALADYVTLGSVDVGYRTDRTTAYTRFGGRLEGLRLVATGSSIQCSSIVARFDNGDSQRVFSGRLYGRQPVSVDLAGRKRKVDRLDFTCRADDRGGTITVAGDLGNYRDDWRRSGYWNPSWGGGSVMPPNRDPLSGPGSFDVRDWTVFGRDSFGRQYDRSPTTSAFRGKRADRIALRAIGADAGCQRVTAYFQDGQRADLRAPATRMTRGAIYQMDLPGGARNVDRIDLLCKAVDARRVEIEIYARNK